MLMAMLKAGGLEVVSDENRRPDRDNPKGYFEDDRVKDLESASDKSWIRGARGKGIKVISHLLRTLPAENFYRVLLARRDLKEVLMSQNKMLDRLGEQNPVDDNDAIVRYQQHLKQVHSMVRVRSNFELLEVDYAGVVSDPAVWSEKIDGFLQMKLNTAHMREVVDERLYRNRRDKREVM
jgi:hypothetical protein